VVVAGWQQDHAFALMFTDRTPHRLHVKLPELSMQFSNGASDDNLCPKTLGFMLETNQILICSLKPSWLAAPYLTGMMNVKMSENGPIRLEMNAGWPSEKFMLAINMDSYVWCMYQRVHFQHIQECLHPGLEHSIALPLN
jgi:hypothetical protein